MAVDMAAPFVWGYGGRRLTPEEILMERKAASALGSEAMSTAPVGHWSQGLNRVLQGLMAGYDSYSADQASKQNGTESAAVIQALLGGGAPAVAPVTATPAAAPPMGATAIPAGRDEFVNTIMPMAQEASARTGLDPRMIVAQAALESGWGKSAPGNNLFGIKSHGMPGGNTMSTTEVVNGQPVTVQDSFRAYASPADSVKGYADFMTQNPRYEPVRSAQGLEAQVAALGKSGYATDPNYAAKVMQIAQGLPAPAGGVPVPSAAARPSINPAIVQAISSPYMSDSAKKIGTMLFQNNLEQQQKAADPLRQLQIKEAQSKLTPLSEPYRDSDGNLVQKDSMGKVTMLAPSRTQFSDIGTDPTTGNPIKGFVSPDAKKVEPYKMPGTENAAPSTLPPVPPGVDPKLWREGQSKEAILKALPGSFDDTAKLRGEFTGLPSYKNLSQAAPIYRSMSDAAGRNTKAADLNMVYGLGKIMDPGSVVREGEIQMANNAQGWQEKLNGIISQINNEGGLTPAGRQALMAEAYSRIAAYKGEFDQDAERFRGIAGRNRINAEDVVPNFGDFKPWEVPKAGQPVVIDGYKIKAR